MAAPLSLMVALGMAFVSATLMAATVERQTLRRMEEHWRRVGAAHGLHWLEDLGTDPTLDGVIDGRTVSVREVLRHTGEARKHFTRVDIHLASPIPGGLELARPVLGGALLRRGREQFPLGMPEVDRALALYGPDTPRVRALAASPVLQRVLAEAVDRGRIVELEDRRLRVFQVGRAVDDLEPRLEAAFALAEALCAVVEAPWREAAGRWGLDRQRNALRVRLAGAVPAGELTVTTRLDLEGLPTRVVLRFASPLEPTFSVTRRQDCSGRTGVNLGDPVLDGMVAVSSRDPEAVRRLLKRPEVRGPLLAVNHPFPLSRTTHEGVTLHVDDLDPDTLVARVEDVLELAAALTAEGRVGTDGSSPRETP